LSGSAKDISPRHAALIAGIALLLMTALAIFANFFVIQRLINEDIYRRTVENIMDNETLFRFGIVSLIIVVILDVIVAWAFYILLRSVNKDLAILMSWSRLIYAAIFGAAIIELVNALSHIHGEFYIFNYDDDITSFSNAWETSMAVFGLHLVLLGYLTYISGFIPKIIGILLVIAGIGYAINSILTLMVQDYGGDIVFLTFWGELVFMIWLLIRWKRIPLDDAQQTKGPLPPGRTTQRVRPDGFSRRR
jgi:hypothetical protein